MIYGPTPSVHCLGMLAMYVYRIVWALYICNLKIILYSCTRFYIYVYAYIFITDYMMSIYICDGLRSS
jgi:hypothetical protein